MDRRSDASSRHDDTRQAILEAARELFMVQGYRAVSTRQVADACGLTQPALYYHFGGKQDLYVAVLEDQLDSYRAALTAITVVDDTGRSQLRRAIRVLMQRSDLDHGQMFHDIRWELSTDRQRDIRASFERSMIEPLVTIIRRAQEEGLINSDRALSMSPIGLSMHLLGIVRFGIESMGFERREDGSVPSPGSWVELVERLFLDGVGRRS